MSRIMPSKDFKSHGNTVALPTSAELEWPIEIKGSSAAPDSLSVCEHFTLQAQL